MKWTKSDAVKRLVANQELLKVYGVYPLSRLLVMSAVAVKRYEGYNRISFHYAYKDWMWAATGDENKEFWICMHVIDDLLPQDAADLHTESPCIYDPNPPLPGLPPLPEKAMHPKSEKGKYKLLSIGDLLLDDSEEKRHLRMRELLEEIATLRIAYLALSVPNTHGQQIFATFTDIAGKGRYIIYKPISKEYWTEDKIHGALTKVTGDLQKNGYVVRIVPIEEYLASSSRQRYPLD